MYTIIFGAALGAVIGSFINGTSGDIIGAFIGALVGLGAAISLFSYLVPRRNVVNKPVKLVAVRSSDGISETFIWASGELSNRTTYNFLQLMEDGSMVPGCVPANHLVHLIEDPELKDTGFWSTTINEADKTSPLYAWAIDTCDWTEPVRQEFRVPIGTVTNAKQCCRYFATVECRGV
jgi:hypothetical protein